MTDDEILERRAPSERGGELSDLFHALAESFDADSGEREKAELAAYLSHYGERVRRARRKAGMTQAGLARETGIPQGRISRIESGSLTEGPSYTTMCRIGRVLSDVKLAEQRDREEVPIAVADSVSGISDVEWEALYSAMANVAAVGAVGYPIPLRRHTVAAGQVELGKVRRWLDSSPMPSVEVAAGRVRLGAADPAGSAYVQVRGVARAWQPKAGHATGDQFVLVAPEGGTPFLATFAPFAREVE